MSKTYDQALGGHANLDYVVFDDEPPLGSLGRQFVWNCRREMITPSINMAQLNTRFHQWLVGRNWQWIPGGPGGSFRAGALLLDGVAVQGECGFPANALAYMINAPAPYGFGVGGATVERYTGRHERSFISNHANVLQVPQSNINRPVGGVLPGFYYWGNHKVVLFNGRYYDPNYNAVYNALTDMEVAALQVVRQNVYLNEDDLEEGTPISDLYQQILLEDRGERITVTQATNVTNAAVTGFYIEWRYVGIYGPYVENPLPM